VNGGTGTILAGDIVQFGGAGNKHIVGTGTGDASGGTIVLNVGLEAEVANDTAVAIQADHSPSHMFHRNAVELVMRAPAMPDGGDGADDVITVTDPHSGLVFQVAIYRGYHKSLIEVSTVYGAKVWKPEFVTTMIGGA